MFFWIEIYRQEQAVSEKNAEDPTKDWLGLYDEMKPEWDKTATYCEMVFLNAVLTFRSLSIREALASDNYIISSCFADREEAEKALLLAKQRTPREEWVLNCHTIGQCDWADGFVRTSAGEDI